MIPLGVADTAVQPLPLVTLTVAAASVCLTLLAWLAPDGPLAAAHHELATFAADHPDQLAPTACDPWLRQQEGRGSNQVGPASNQVGPASNQVGPASKQAEHGSKHLDQGSSTATLPPSAEFELRCIKASDAARVGGLLRWSVQPTGRMTSTAAWLLHPFAWANPAAGAMAMLMLVLVVGSAVEQHYGRAHFGAMLVGAVVLSAVIWQQTATDANAGWAGGQGVTAAVLAVFCATFATRPVRFLTFSPLPKQVLQPAWAVAVWWLVVRTVTLVVAGVERPQVFAELGSFVLALVATLLVLHRIAPTLAPTPSTQRHDSTHLEPQAHAEPIAVARSAKRPAESDRRSAEPAAPLDPSAPAPDAAWAVSAADPYQEPQIRRKKVATPPPIAAATWASGAAVAPSVPDQQPAARLIGPAVNLPFALVDEPTVLQPAAVAAPHPVPTAGLAAPLTPHLFDFSTANAIEFVGQGAGFHTTLSAMLPQAKAATKIAAPGPTDAEFEFDLNAFYEVQPSTEALDRDTALALPPSAAWAPSGPPPVPAYSPYDESTVAYGRVRPASLGLSAFADDVPLAPKVQLARSIDRDEYGVLRAHMESDSQSLAADCVRAVAVGLVIHANYVDVAPEIWIDVITDLGGKDRPAVAVRLHPARDDLLRLLPGLSSAAAFAALADELARGGAFQLPQQPIWPGPPFPRYATAADFIRMWHTQLHG
ncbi:MAG: hypothetical protein EXR77_01045 [Myxococcales bacterium]|nr:hypothetical protein [Myxococcales bacterium]